MAAYYNENDPYAAQWLRNLVRENLIAPGDVDERSIADVRPDDLRGYTQCHFFAGIGGWSLALRLAGWPDARPVWTGSCPCQPFSAAGKGKAADDERHLWPRWFPLIRELRPAIVFGEQVEAAIGWGWLDAVFADLEAEGYACGAAVLPACGVGAPHIRARTWFVADAMRGRAGHPSRQGVGAQAAADSGDGHLPGQRLRARVEGASGSVADPERGAAERWRHNMDGATARAQDKARQRERLRPDPGSGRVDGSVANAHGRHASAEGLQRSREHGQQPQDGRSGRLGHPHDARSQGRRLDLGEHADQRVAGAPSQFGELADARHEQAGRPAGCGEASSRRAFGDATGCRPWRDLDWLPCTDGKARPVEPGTFPLAHGIPGRVGRLRAYGNAIVPQVAAEFIRAATD